MLLQWPISMVIFGSQTFEDFMPDQHGVAESSCGGLGRSVRA